MKRQFIVHSSREQRDAPQERTRWATVRERMSTRKACTMDSQEEWAAQVQVGLNNLSKLWATGLPSVAWCLPQGD